MTLCLTAVRQTSPIAPAQVCCPMLCFTCSASPCPSRPVRLGAVRSVLSAWRCSGDLLRITMPLGLSRQSVTGVRPGELRRRRSRRQRQRSRRVRGAAPRTRCPAPGWLCTSTSPPCARATARTSASPSPVPRPGPLAPLRNLSKTCRSSSAGMPWPVSATIMRTGRPYPTATTDNFMTSPLVVCRTAFSSSASTARPSRSRSARTVTLSSWPSCQRRSAVGRHLRRISMVKLSRATGSGCRNSGPSAAAMTSSRSAIRRSRFSSPSTTWMSCPSWRLVRPLASSSAWPSAMVIGVRS